MTHETYLRAIKSDYKSMMAKLERCEVMAQGFEALSHSSIKESKQAYESETGQKVLRNSKKIAKALADLRNSLEII